MPAQTILKSLSGCRWNICWYLFKRGSAFSARHFTSTGDVIEPDITSSSKAEKCWIGKDKDSKEKRGLSVN